MKEKNDILRIARLHEKRDYFELARGLTRTHAKSFYFSCRFLPKQTRVSTYAVYSFCRYVDNIVDNPRNRNIDQIRSEIDAIRKELELAYSVGESEHPVLGAFIPSALICGIPVELPMDLIRGVEMDLTIDRYETFDDLYLFAYRVAGVVGLMMTYVLGFKDKDALIYAEKLGIAMQLTNILRDIKEDKDNGRIYLPLEELHQYKIAEEHIISEKFNDFFRRMMEFQVERAWKYYRDAEPGISMLQRKSQFAIIAASRIYSGILNKIAQNGYNPFGGRAHVSSTKKVSILLSELLKTRLIPA